MPRGRPCVRVCVRAEGQRGGIVMSHWRRAAAWKSAQQQQQKPVALPPLITLSPGHCTQSLPLHHDGDDDGFSYCNHS